MGLNEDLFPMKSIPETPSQVTLIRFYDNSFNHPPYGVAMQAATLRLHGNWDMFLYRHETDRNVVVFHINLDEFRNTLQ